MTPHQAGQRVMHHAFTKGCTECFTQTEACVTVRRRLQALMKVFDHGNAQAPLTYMDTIARMAEQSMHGHSQCA